MPYHQDLPYAKTFIAAGFQIVDTGGNCTAWRRDTDRGFHVLITDTDGLSHWTDDDMWYVGWQSDDGDVFCDEVWEGEGYLAALAEADRILVRDDVEHAMKVARDAEFESVCERRGER